MELSSPDGLTATYAPRAGMVCCSLRHGGEELLGQRQGLRAYASAGATMGVPLLYPWANRLARRGYSLGHTRVEFPADAPAVRDDGKGLPIHGLLAGCPDWQVRELEASAEAARLVAHLDFGERPDLMELFPFPHALRMEVALRGSTLTITTALRATGESPVPVAFGYHPYFRLPGVPREKWKVQLPVRTRMLLDERCLPTGQVEPVQIATRPLGDRSYDDLFVELDPDPVFALFGGGRRIEVAFGAAYRFAVVYAPPDDDVICFEPMTAPTSPFEGGAELAWAAPGEEFTATFAVTVG